MSVERKDYPERVWLERDEETNEKRWFTVPGMGVEYALATRPEREAQEVVADVMDQHLAAIAIASSYGGDEGWCWLRRYQSGDPECAAQAQAFDGRKFATPPDAAATIARLEKERDEAVERYGAAIADAASLRADVQRKQTLIHRYMNDDVFTRAARAEAEAARLREAVKAAKAEEREACAKACEDRAAYFDRAPGYRDWKDAARSYRATADDIRSRSALDQPARDEVRG